MSVKICLKSLVILLVCAFFAGCSTYGSRMEETRLLFSQGEYDEALKKLEKTESGSSKLLYMLERGMILHYAGRYEESNNIFEEAEILAEDLYTKSVSKELGAFLTSDNTILYEGEKFERALIHYYRAFNYINLGLPDDALVECRKVSFLLQRYLDESEESSAYSDDAFMHYLAGILFEWQGEINDAFISYRKAAESYERYEEEYGISQPSSLKSDLLRAASALRFEEEYNYYLEKYGDSYVRPETDEESGELILIHENGFAPNKDAIEIAFPILKVDKPGDDFGKYSRELRSRADHHYADVDIEYMLRVSMPTYESTRPGIAYMEVSTSGNQQCPPLQVSSEMVEDVEAIAMKNFVEDEPIILLRTLARGVAKYLAFKTAKKKGGDVGGILVNVFNFATENADTRSWLTLPNSFGMARMSLPPGKYDLHLSFRDENGREVKSANLQGVEIRSDDFTFLNYRTFQ